MNRTFVFLFVAFMAGCSDDGATPEVVGDAVVDDVSTDGVASDAPADAVEETAADTGTPPVDATSDAPTDAPGDAPADAPKDGATAGLACGSTTCAPGKNCCVTAGIATCIDPGAPCVAAYECTRPSDCPSGQVCCAKALAGSAGASCVATCGTTTLCATAADCSGSKKNCVDVGGGIKMCTK